MYSRIARRPARRAAARTLTGLAAAALAACTEGPRAPLAPSARSDVAAGSTPMWVVAFTQTNGLPADADKLVAAAGGTVVSRLPEIGGLAATSTNPSFAATMACTWVA